MPADDEMPDANGEHRDSSDILPPPATLPPPSGPPTGGAADGSQEPAAAGFIANPAESAGTYALPAAAQHAQMLQEEAIKQVDLRRRMRATVVPVIDADVRDTLRQLGEPVTLFGEQEMERRARLRKLLAAMDEDEKVEKLGAPEPEQYVEAQVQTEKFYTEGSPALKAARLQIAHWSLERAMDRISSAKRKRESPDEDEVAEIQKTLGVTRRVVGQSSEFGDERPIWACQFSPSGTELATAAWSGLVKVWAVPACQKTRTIKAHDNRITGLAWHPHAGAPGQPDTAPILATGSADMSARLWSASGQELHRYLGHTDRLGRIAMHPMGRHLGTASYDQTWRLWDLETGDCLLEQEGHSRSVYAVAFQPDGALAASGGLDAVGRVWDLRSGHSILALEGHVKTILSIDFSPNGYQLLTGSEDHTAKIWDLRKRKVLYTLPGHTSSVSQVKFEPNDGYYFMTAGFDNTLKLWTAHDFKMTNTLAGHEGKVMGADISPDGSGLIASVGYDRTIKLWAPEG
ncbi:hypothetical protein CVIRNUC_001676 [Coccomyxa viridis]|uniref:Pre-mRNA processing factor 4 (PRP4)-like domain-containing protein n=1 Tax=Coccomyxa viridis TaxID=1274662 RepID=A0AAV1HV86_9CHLO|nr:hypothetical protein CVIRNUC_001676 [Coccomyxa viridis]